MRNRLFVRLVICASVAFGCTTESLAGRERAAGSAAGSVAEEKIPPPPKMDLSGLPRPWREAEQCYREAGELIGKTEYDSALGKLSDAGRELGGAYATFAKHAVSRLGAAQSSSHKDRELSHLCAQLGAHEAALELLARHMSSNQEVSREDWETKVGLLVANGRLEEGRKLGIELIGKGTSLQEVIGLETCLNLADAIERETEHFEFLFWRAAKATPQHWGEGSDYSFLSGVSAYDKALEKSGDAWQQAAAIRGLIASLRELSHGGDGESASAWSGLLSEHRPALARAPDVTDGSYYLGKMNNLYWKSRFQTLMRAREERIAASSEAPGYRLGEFGLPIEATHDRQLVVKHMEAVASSDGNVSKEARWKLDLFGSLALGVLIDSLTTEDLRLLRVVCSLLPERQRMATLQQRARTHNALLEAFHGRDNMEAKLTLMRCLAKVPDARRADVLLPFIRENLSSPHAGVRTEVARLCAAVPCDETLERLLVLLKGERDDSVLASIMQALEGFDDPRASGALVRFLNHQASSVRSWALNAIRSNPDHVDPEILAAHKIFRPLAYRSDPNVVPALRKALLDESLSDRERGRARNALERFLEEQAEREVSGSEFVGKNAIEKDHRKVLASLELYAPHADIFSRGYDARCSRANYVFKYNPSIVAPVHARGLATPDADKNRAEWIDMLSLWDAEQAIARVKELPAYREEVAAKSVGPASDLVSRLTKARENPALRMIDISVELAKPDGSVYGGVDRIPVAVTVTNRTDRPVEVSKSDKPRVEWIIRRATADWYIHHSTYAFLEEGAGPVRLEAGESIKMQTRVGYLFPWSAPGQYAMRARWILREQDRTTTFTSNEVSLEIKPIDFRDDAVLEELREVLRRRSDYETDELIARGAGSRAEMLMFLGRSTGDKDERITVCLHILDNVSDAKVIDKAKSRLISDLDHSGTQDHVLAGLERLSEVYPEALYILGRKFRERQEYQKAIAAYARYLSLRKDEPSQDKGVTQMLACYKEGGELEQAVTLALEHAEERTALGRHDKADSILVFISECYLQTGDRRRALLALQMIELERRTGVEAFYDDVRERMGKLRNEISTMESR